MYNNINKLIQLKMFKYLVKNINKLKEFEVPNEEDAKVKSEKN